MVIRSDAHGRIAEIGIFEEQDLDHAMVELDKTGCRTRRYVTHADACSSVVCTTAERRSGMVHWAARPLIVPMRGTRVRYRSREANGARWRDFEPREVDIVISTCSKNGTTWMR